jgi:mRNA-degrading endonuclease toxin of MazEF toxin-antitoxin module
MKDEIKNPNLQKITAHKNWSKTKLKIDINSNFPMFVSEGQVWWCQMGQNIGVEINGRNKNNENLNVFFRPVAIFKKYNKRQGLVIPLTESYKEGIYYANFNFQGQITTALLSQARTIDFSRLSSENNKPIGELDEKDYNKLQQKFIELIKFKPNKKPPKGSKLL